MDEGAPNTELVANLRWLQKLARELVRDPHAADDAVQRTFVTALSRPPRDRTSFRGWLAAVLRTEVRQERRRDARRRDREERATPPNHSPSTLDVVEELVLHRRLVDLVHGLDEPYRTTLVLRFLRELTPRDIAREESVPVKTVHTRIERGLARLRERLDRESKGDRRAWVLAFLPLARTQPAVAGIGLGTWMLPMNAKLLTVATGVVAVGAIAVIPFVLDTNPVERAAAPDTGRDANVALAGAPDETDPVEADADDRSAVAPHATAEPEPTPPPVTPLVEGLVVDLEGQPVAGVGVVFEHERDGAFVRDPAIPIATTSAAGSFTIPLAEERGRLSAAGADHASVSNPFLEGTLPAEPPLIVVAPRRTYAGRVVDGDDLGVEGAEVVISFDGSFMAAVTVHPPGSDARTVHLRLPLARTHTDASGEFTLEGVGFVEGAFLGAERDGFGSARIDLPESTTTDLVLQLARPEPTERSLFGVVVDASGTPAPDTHVAFGWTSVETAPDGRFRLEVESWYPRGPVIAAKAGHLPARAEFTWEAGAEGTDAEHPLTLTLGGPPLEIRGRVVDEAGEPVAGVAVWTPDTSYFGPANYEGAGRTMRGESTMERLVAGIRTGGPWDLSVWATSAEDGSFVLAGLLPRDYAVFAVAHDTLARVEPVIATAGDRNLELTLEGDAGRERVAGRVVSTGGRALAGVEIALGRHIDWERPSPPPTAGWDRSPLQPPSPTKQFRDSLIRTDEEGRFEFEGVHLERSFLFLTGSSILIGEHLWLDERDDPAELEIVVEACCHFRVVLEDPDEADAFARETETGVRMPFFIELEGSTISAPDVEIREGRSAVATIGEGPCTLMLLKEGEVVRRVDVEFEAGDVQEIRL